MNDCNGYKAAGNGKFRVSIRGSDYEGSLGTYTDAKTGLRFTVLPVTGDYDNNGAFTLLVNQTFTSNASTAICAVRRRQLSSPDPKRVATPM